MGTLVLRAAGVWPGAAAGWLRRQPRRARVAIGGGAFQRRGPPRCSGGAQAVLRRCSGGAQAVLRRCSGLRRSEPCLQGCRVGPALAGGGSPGPTSEPVAAAARARDSRSARRRRSRCCTRQRRTPRRLPASGGTRLELGGWGQWVMVWGKARAKLPTAEGIAALSCIRRKIASARRGRVRAHAEMSRLYCIVESSSSWCCAQSASIAAARQRCALCTTIISAVSCSGVVPQSACSSTPPTVSGVVPRGSRCSSRVRPSSRRRLPTGGDAPAAADETAPSVAAGSSGTTAAQPETSLVRPPTKCLGTCKEGACRTAEPAGTATRSSSRANLRSGEAGNAMREPPGVARSGAISQRAGEGTSSGRPSTREEKADVSRRNPMHRCTPASQPASQARTQLREVRGVVGRDQRRGVPRRRLAVAARRPGRLRVKWVVPRQGRGGVLMRDALSFA
jgi:hypothetical protein